MIKICINSAKSYVITLPYIFFRSLIADMTNGGVHGPIEGYNSLDDMMTTTVPPIAATVPTAAYTHPKWMEPYFDPSTPRNVTALMGKSAYLSCRVRNLANKTVSGSEMEFVDGGAREVGRGMWHRQVAAKTLLSFVTIRLVFKVFDVTCQYILPCPCPHLLLPYYQTPYCASPFWLFAMRCVLLAEFVPIFVVFVRLLIWQPGQNVIPLA